MIEVSEAAVLLETLATYLRPPEGYLRPKSDGLPSGRVLAARALAAALNDAGVSLEEATEAVGRILASQDPADRFWPSPGRILSLTRHGITAAAIITETDANRAFEDFVARMRWCIACRLVPALEGTTLDEMDPLRSAAMFAALTAVGGARAWNDAPDAARDPIGFAGVRKRWIAAYTEARRRQAADPGVVRAISSAHPQAKLTRKE